MSNAEMHYDFDVKIDKVASLSTASFNTAEKDWLLTEATDIFTKRVFRSKFELNQKKIDDLSTLVIKGEEVTLALLSDTNVYEYDLNLLAHTYMFFIRGTAEVVENTTCKLWTTMKFIQHDDLDFASKDPFNKSSKDAVLFNFGRSSNGTGSSIYLYPDTLTLGKLRLDYIKKPKRMYSGGYQYIDGTTPAVQECELPTQVHSQVVDIAVEIASGIIEHPEYVQLKARKTIISE